MHHAPTSVPMGWNLAWRSRSTVYHVAPALQKPQKGCLSSLNTLQSSCRWLHVSNLNCKSIQGFTISYGTQVGLSWIISDKDVRLLQSDHNWKVRSIDPEEWIRVTFAYCTLFELQWLGNSANPIWSFMPNHVRYKLVYRYVLQLVRNCCLWLITLEKKDWWEKKWLNALQICSLL